MNYLELVNYVIRESGNELNELDNTTWGTATGQRLYPRLKRYVAQAWTKIQMSRDQWEFNQAELNATVYPRFKFEQGSTLTVPPVAGTVFSAVGLVPSFSFTVRRVLLELGDWDEGTAIGQLEYEVHTGNTRVPLGTTFQSADTNQTFNFTGVGSYTLDELDMSGLFEFAEPAYSTMTASQDNSTSHSVMFVPWESWFYKNLSFVEATQTPPLFASQDFEGKLVFYPQTVNPFVFSMISTLAPQTLVLATDVPARLPRQYHEWIAWEALISLATYDKNSSLAAHANRNAMFFRNRAERNLMPMISYRGSAYNE